MLAETLNDSYVVSGISRTIFFSRETGNFKYISRDPGKFSGKKLLNKSPEFKEPFCKTNLFL